MQETLAPTTPGGSWTCCASATTRSRPVTWTVRLARESASATAWSARWTTRTRRVASSRYRRICLAGEIIHNPHVNAKLREMGIGVLAPRARASLLDRPRRGRGILPAFGVTIPDFEQLRALGAWWSTPPCGSVLNVWKRVEAYAARRASPRCPRQALPRETRATASQVQKLPGGALPSCPRHGRSVRGSASTSRVSAIATASSPLRARRVAGLRSELHLRRVGVANQTTSSRVRAWHRRGGGPANDRTRTAPITCRALPHVRHHLLGHAGPTGRGGGAAARAAGRDDRDRRLQLEQHDLAGRAVRRARGHLPRGVARGDRRRARRGALPADRCARAGDRAGGLAARRGRGARGITAGAARRTTRSARPSRACSHARHRSGDDRGERAGRPGLRVGGAGRRRLARGDPPRARRQDLRDDARRRQWLWTSDARCVRRARRAGGRRRRGVVRPDRRHRRLRRVLPDGCACVLPAAAGAYAGLALPITASSGRSRRSPSA